MRKQSSSRKSALIQGREVSTFAEKRLVVLGKLAASQYKVTNPRTQLLEAIIKQKAPFSADDLYLAMKAASHKRCDLVTIYRALPIFEEINILEKCDFSDDRTHYELKHDDSIHHHHHIVCENCDKIEPLEICIVESQEHLLKRLGYTKLSHRLEFSGMCPSCS